ncbi:KAP family P-loop NTPase fold protein [Lacihabitans soyangensis]|uniref:KAP NTPase domain-containing protein n=1 Tax=Lacihabitans soyangensis TaxID=869394 RepID=A0AAE3KUE0_9BACT|nr:P-loop NTPase fold protein [Lacihabitans soyangensis]MCP9765472.1 hypothetical protein [Lacihabitans soyangensis]
MKTLRDIENKINPDNPFEDCKLEREKYADNLTQIIKNYPSGFVMALNNRWGDGKTFFVNRWREKLKKEEFQVVYYNAWEDDYSENALVSIISEISEDIKDPNQELLDKVLEKGTGLFIKSLPVLLKIAGKKIAGKDGYEDLANLIGEEMGKPFKSLIEEYKNQKKTVAGFRESLRNFAESVGKGKPIVFYIDELDRCKPSYAVEVLELIKHLFSVDNIVFVLSVDKEQLANTVRGYYGSDQIDGNEYLKRFIDLEFSLPKPKLNKFIEISFEALNFNEHYVEFRNDYGFQVNEISQLLSFITVFAQNKNFKLRATKQLLYKLRTILYSFNKNDYTIPSVLTILIYLQSTDIEMFEKIKNKEIRIEEFLEWNKNLLLPGNSPKKSETPIAFKRHEFVLYSLYSNYINNHFLIDLSDVKNKESFHSIFEKVSIDSEILYNNISKQGNFIFEAEYSIDYLINKIELSENLKFNN